MNINNIIIELGAVAAALATIAGVVWAVVKFAVLKPLDKRIKEVTKQIQPGANGGESLSDANRKIDNLSEDIEHLIERIEAVETRQMSILEYLLSLHKKDEEKNE